MHRSGLTLKFPNELYFVKMEVLLKTEKLFKGFQESVHDENIYVFMYLFINYFTILFYGYDKM